MKFGDLVKSNAPELLVSRRHDAWMTENRELVYSERALNFARDQLAAKTRIRKASYSASSLGSCKRAQQFTYLGMPELTPEVKGMSIFSNGDFMHLRWQMAGITEGWLQAAEVPVPENVLGLSGTMDGVLYDESVLELKSINDNGFRGILTYGPQKKHKMQGAAYLVASEREKISFIYENKNDQEYREYVLTREDLAFEIEAVSYSTDDLWSHTGNKTLVDPLSKCIDREGFDYKYCQFRHICLGVKDWDDAVRQAGS